MDNDQEHWQQQDERERFTRSVGILSEASTRALREDELLFLAIELGLSKKDVQVTEGA